jgi:lipid-binding SYLF domain-containing protein
MVMKYIVPLVLVLCAVGCANPRGATALEQRDYVNNMHDATLKALYEQDPSAQQKIADAAGHAVFGYYGTNLILLSTEGGYGVAIDHATGQRTYMKLRGGGIGIGIGVKDARAVLAFRSQAAFDQFVSSDGKFTFGANADAVAKSDDQGDGTSNSARSGDVEVFAVNKNGIMLAASVVGTKFYRDQQLNAVDAPTENPGSETVAETEWDHEFMTDDELAGKTPPTSTPATAETSTQETPRTDTANTDPGFEE